MTFYWGYVELDSYGRLRDTDTLLELNPNFPNFYSEEEAERYLVDHNVRATVVRKAAQTVTPPYPNYIMEYVRQYLELEPYDTSRDQEIKDMSKGEVFEKCLLWEGIIGYDYRIKGWIKDIYGVILE